MDVASGGEINGEKGERMDEAVVGGRVRRWDWAGRQMPWMGGRQRRNGREVVVGGASMMTILKCCDECDVLVCR